MPAKTPLAAGDVVIVPAWAPRADDAVAAVSPGCLCMLPRFADSQMPGGREAKLRELCRGDDPPGLIAYVGDEVAGWLGFGPVALLPRLRRSTTLTQVDDAPVWSIVCFRIARRFKGRGLARLLLDAAVEYVQSRGAPAIQAYPIDADGGPIAPTSAYVGLSTWFDDAGFQRVAVTKSTGNNRPRVLMRKYF